MSQEIRPWELDRCPVTGLPIRRRPEWTKCSFGLDDYSITFSLVGEKVILAKIWGYSTLPATTAYLALLNAIMDASGADGRKFFVLEDYAEHRGASIAAKNKYIEHMKRHPRVQGVGYFGTSALFNLIIKFGRSIARPPFPVEILPDYAAAVSWASGGSNAPAGVMAAFPRRAPDEWTLSLDDYSIRIETFGRDIVFTSAGGFLKEHHIPGFVSLYEKVLRTLDPGLDHYYRIMDWTGMRGSSWKARGLYLSALRELNRIKPCRASILYGLNRTMGILLKVSTPFAPMQLYTARDFEGAFKMVDRIKSGKAPKAARGEDAKLAAPVLKTEIERFLAFMGDLNWDRRDAEITDIPVDEKNPFRPLYEALFVIKSDFDAVLDEVVHSEKTQKQLEDRLRQAEKMEAIGLLAGGIAHDFNNQLAGILGNAEMLNIKAKDHPAIVEYGERIIRSVNQSAKLIAQLLAFARKGRYQTVPIDVHKVIEDVVQILTHSIDKRILIEKALAPGSLMILGEPSLIESALLNVALNARDAMPEGGVLNFSTGRIVMDKKACAGFPFEIHPGEFVRISVSDTGTGMDEETKAHMFEPFFTTKKSGFGTGMGLAAVYGAVKSHNGYLDVKSGPGRGTEFVIGLPLLRAAQGPGPEKTGGEPARGTARILLAEDEPSVGEIAVEILNFLGYETVLCRNGREAVERFRKDWVTVDLVILDIIMPVMDGKDAFREIMKINPSARVLFSSGYTADGEIRSLIDAGAKGFIEKPYKIANLSSAIARIL